MRLLAVSFGSVPDTCQGFGVGFEFTPNFQGIYDYVEDTVPQEPMVCSNEHGGGGGPVDPNIFYAGAFYKDMPSGLRHYLINVSVPYRINGPWRVTWMPPMTSEPTPTPAAGACLTLDKWNQLSAQNDPLPSGLGGKILTSQMLSVKDHKDFPPR